MAAIATKLGFKWDQGISLWLAPGHDKYTVAGSAKKGALTKLKVANNVAFKSMQDLQDYVRMIDGVSPKRRRGRRYYRNGL